MILRFFAQVFSYVFHPLFIVTYMLLLFIWINPFSFGFHSFESAMKVHDITVIRVFFSTALLPGVAVILMKFLGLIDSMKMVKKEERIGPYIATGTFYAFIFYNIRSNPNLPEDFKVFLFGATLALAVAFFINLFSKISIHGVAMGGVLGVTLMGLVLYQYSDFLPLAFILILSVGLVGTARLILKAHVPNDVYGGYFVGLICQFIAFAILM